MKNKFFRLLALQMSALVLWSQLALAQDVPPPPPPGVGDKPVMENVFFNVVWGSATGVLIGGALAIIGSQDKSNPTTLRADAVTGASVGGIIGLGVGVFLVFSGISFDPGRSTIMGMGGVTENSYGPQPIFTQPVAFTTDPRDSSRINGFSVLVVDTRF